MAIQQFRVLLAFVCIFLGVSYQSYSCEVRFGNELCEEVAALATRIDHNKKGLEKYLGFKIKAEKIPNVSFVLSGGGFRAMIVSMAAMLAAEQTGLVDCVRYASGLSGSTWMLASWMSHDEKFEPFCHDLYDKIEQGLKKLSMKKSAEKWWDTTLVDLWGDMIGETLLDERKSPNLTLSFLQKRLESGKYPIPLFSAVTPIEKDIYEWVSFSPFEVGTCGSQCYIPTQFLGSTFEHGKLVRKEKEPLLKKMLGIFGSAFSVSGNDVTNAYGLGSTVSSLCNSRLFKNNRVSIGTIPNFFYKMCDFSKIAKNQDLGCVDAGLDFNLPFPPLFRRNVDVYIVCDASGSAQEQQLLKAQTYAKKHKIPFPEIDFSQRKGEKISLFMNEEDATVPVIIYIKNPDHINFATEKFKYSVEEFIKITDYYRKLFKEFDSVIKYAIQQKTK